MLWTDVLERCVEAQVRFSRPSGAVIQGPIESTRITDVTHNMEISCRWLVSSTPGSKWVPTNQCSIQFNTTHTRPREAGGNVIRITLENEGEIEILPPGHRDTLSLGVVPSQC